MDKLRFGILCNGATFPAWQAQCIAALLNGGDAEPVVLIQDARPPQPPAPPWKRISRLLRLRFDLFSFYNRTVVERRCAAIQPVDMSEELAGIPRLRCVVERRGKFSEYFTPADLEAIRDHRPDFLLRFGFNIIRGGILTLPRFGVWSFHHGDEQKYRGAPPCFWEIFHDDPQTGVILQRLTERLDGGIVLRKALFPTVLHSYPLNRSTACGLGASWPAEVCRDIRAGNAPYLDAAPSSSTAPIYLRPGNADFARFVWKQGGHILARAARRGRTPATDGRRTRCAAGDGH